MRDETNVQPACEVIGIDHIYVTVSDLARAEAFYDKVFGVLGFRKNRFVLGDDAHVQYYNRLFGYVLRPARSPAAHDPYAPGLHHLCLRVASAAEVSPVEAHATALMGAPSEIICFTCETSTVIPRSLNEPL